MQPNLKILVTGAAGFIGFHTCLALLKSAEVWGLDNFDPYYSLKLKRARAALLKDEGVHLVEEDICDKKKLIKLIEKEKFTHIIHLAAQAGVRHSLLVPEAYIKSNIDGFLSVLEAVRKFPHIKLIYASSSSVYGQNKKTPYSVEDRTDHQASLYGVTKKANELMAESYHHLFDLDLVGLRFFTVYGPWGRPDMAYFSFAKAIENEETIHLYNYGECQRDFTYVDDIVNGIISCLSIPKGNYIFNLGNNQPVTLLKFVSILEDLLGKKAKTELFPLQPGDVVATWADIEQSKKILGFHPQTSLEEGLAKFITWFKENKSLA